MSERPGRLRELCVALLPQVAALGTAVAAQAHRRSQDPVPPQLLANARRLIGQTARVLSREPGAGLFRLGPAPVWSELDAVLQLAQGALTAFAARRDGPREVAAGREELARLINAKIEEGIERGLAERSRAAQH